MALCAAEDKSYNVCVKLKVKISLYFVTNVFSFILNIVPTNQWHENKVMDTNAFDFQEIKIVGQPFLFFDIVYFLNSAAYSFHLFVFHYKWQSFEIGISNLLLQSNDCNENCA